MEQTLRERVGMLVELDSPQTLVDEIVEIEQTGVEQVWVGAPPWKLEMLTALTAAAMRTSHIKLGTSVLQVFARHPVLLAQQALSLEALAPGRLRLGIGTSSPELGKSIYGVEIERPLAYLREYVKVLRSLLQSGEVHQQGRYFTTDISLEASAKIPLLISALGPKAYHLAGEIADGAIPARSPIHYLLDVALPALREGAAAAGRLRPPIMANVSVALTEDRAIAFEIGRKWFGPAARLSFYRNMYLRAGYSPQEIDTVSDRLIDNLLIFGDEGKIRESLINLLGTELDELRVSVLPVSDPTRERTRMAKIIGNL
jgi:alkanesulfonate monooxygenase SsuD/methylene tetrahydromethanopterin reductase-like flavin-dependent oxidoreductase (luciferase family)